PQGQLACKAAESMEPTGIEPVTSCLQIGSSGSAEPLCLAPGLATCVIGSVRHEGRYGHKSVLSGTRTVSCPILAPLRSPAPSTRRVALRGTAIPSLGKA